MERVARVAVPSRARELAALDRVDYADAFAVDVTSRRTPTQWIEAAAAVSPRLFRTVRLAHRVLGLHLAPADSPGHPIGWDLLRDEDDASVLGNSGLLGTTRIVGLTPPGQMMIVTLIQFNGIVGRTIWAGTAPVHRAVARQALARTADPRSSASLTGS
jgi:hypothetical protein